MDTNRIVRDRMVRPSGNMERAGLRNGFAHCIVDWPNPAIGNLSWNRATFGDRIFDEPVPIRMDYVGRPDGIPFTRRLEMVFAQYWGTSLQYIGPVVWGEGLYFTYDSSFDAQPTW